MNIHRHPGRDLNEEQVAVAAVLCQAISNYSEDSFCAGWLVGIEHELWERLYPRLPDAYEQTVDQLYAAAGKERTDWGRCPAEFAAGLRLLAEGFKVWVYFGEQGETAIRMDEWKPLHEKWLQDQIAERPLLEKIWEQIHNPFPRLKKGEAPPVIPPMPKISPG